MLEPLRLPTAFSWCAKGIVDEEVDAFEQASVVGLPPLVVFPTGLIEDEPHVRSSPRDVYVPTSERSRASDNLRALAGVENR